MKVSKAMTRSEFNRRMRQLGWKLVGPVVAGPASFIKWTKGSQVIYAPDHDIITAHTAQKLLGEAEG